MVRTRPLLALLVMVMGLASYASTSGLGPTVAGGLAPGAALQAAASAPTLTVLDEPAMRRTGSRDGWAVYRVEEGRVPDRLPVGRGFRGEVTWMQDGRLRKARLYVPRTAPAVAPLLVSLHGLSSSLDKVEAQQRWSGLAYQQEFAVAWAAGHEASWNAGPCCGAAAAGRVDDLAYVDRLLQVVGALQGIDRGRVHLAGYSNGGMLAYRYACARPGRIAGVLVVAGTHTAPCVPSSATAVLSVHGALDSTVPLDGTRYSRELRSPLPPVGKAPQQWVRTGASVRSVVLPRFAHGWPTRANSGYDATGEGWRFLAAHPQPAG